MKKLKLNKVPEVVSVQDMLLQSAKKYSTKLAMEDLNDTPLKRVTYAKLLESVLTFGNALKSLGIKERTHIALIGENRVQWAVSFLTSMAFNYVVVPIDARLNSNEILNIVHESDAEALIFSDQYSSIFSEAHSALKRIENFICMDKEYKEENFLSMPKLLEENVAAKEEELPKINPDDMAEIIFTSGSLGRAKGVMLSQKNLASNLMDMVAHLMMYPEDRFLSVLPIHHTYECTCGMLCPLYCGSSVHYSRSLRTVVDDLQNVKATMLLGVPLLFDKMFKRIQKGIQEDKKKAKLVPKLIGITNLTSRVGLGQLKKKVFKALHEKFGGHIRFFIAGGAAPDPLVAKGLREFGFGFLQGYGLTETSPILAVNRDKEFKDEAGGLPLGRVTINIHEPDSSGVGEIWAKGPNVMLGYYKNKKQTEATFSPDGWFKTGDIGFLDKDGFLHIKGRMKNVIISKSGKNVYPEEIEDVLNRSPFVLESMVYGEQDDKQDEIIAAMLVPDGEAFIAYAEENNVQITSNLIEKIMADEIKLTNKQLTGFKHIKKFYVRENEFEKTTTQKIKRYLVGKK